jgi:anti-sigma-K factor RskA
VLRVVAGPRALVATLAPQAGVRGSGRMVVDATSGEAALLVSGLQPPPPGKTYELWAIRGDRPPEPAGLFSVGQEGWLAARMPPLHETAGITAFAVSVEPAGGSEAPSGPIVLTGGVTG